MPFPARQVCALRAAFWLATAVMFAIGCTTHPYQYSRFPHPDAGGSSPGEILVEYGEPHKTLDRIGWVVGMPARILPLNSKINNHHLAPETIDKLKLYLQRNDLTDVAVFVNDYDPKEQWRRLRANTLVSPGWRYTAGVLRWLGYTVLPGRVFGGDRYSPYTNSLSLHSDVPALVLAEAAYAKNIHGRKLPGTYAAINDLPFVSLGADNQAVTDVLGYARDQHDWEVEKEAYRVLYPRLGADMATLGVPFIGAWWGGPLLGLSGAAVGHVTGRAMASHRAGQQPADPPQVADSPAAKGREIQLVSLPQMPPLQCPWFDTATESWHELALSSEW